MTALRFCMVTTFYPPHNFGGDGMAVQHLSRALVHRGHEVTVVYDQDAFFALGGQRALPADHAPDGVQVVPLRSRAGMLSPVLTQQTGRPVLNGGRLRTLLAGGFDVVHFHNVSLVGGPGVLSYPAGGAVRLYTAHEHWLVCPTHTLWRYGREACPERDCLRCQLSYRRPPQLWRWTGLLERQARHVDAFIALSEFSRAKHRQMGFGPDMEVLPLFLADPERAAEPPATPHGAPYFLFVGRLERLKALDEVIPLFRDGTGPDLLVAGTGTQEAALRAAAAGSARVRFLGALPPDRLRAHVRGAVAVVVPSRCYETFGLVVIEALREGTPVIARRIGPLPELVETSGGGVLFDTDEELEAALLRMAGDAEFRARCGAAGRAAFELRWSEAAVLPRYLELVERLRARRQAPEPAAAARDGA
jgi:glycosyltransferase involved in cell wall biosynthesis